MLSRIFLNPTEKLKIRIALKVGLSETAPYIFGRNQKPEKAPLPKMKQKLKQKKLQLKNRKIQIILAVTKRLYNANTSTHYDK